jgi:hypothetical protein
MPKAAADQVVIHRIEFQESERQMLQDVTAVWQFNRIMDPLVRLINDNTTLLLILTLLGGWLGFKYIPPALEDAYQQVVEFQNQLEAALEAGTVARERIDLVGNWFVRGPLWGGIDLWEYLSGQNVPDFGTGYEPPVSGTSSGGGGSF